MFDGFIFIFWCFFLCASAVKIGLFFLIKGVSSIHYHEIKGERKSENVHFKKVIKNALIFFLNKIPETIFALMFYYYSAHILHISH
jgi:hypothetical protein